MAEYTLIHIYTFYFKIKLQVVFFLILKFKQKFNCRPYQNATEGRDIKKKKLVLL